MIKEFLNPTYFDKVLIGREIMKTGSRVVFLGNGFNTELEKIFYESLIGQSNYQSLSPYEQELSALRRDLYRVLTIFDLDGVLAQPLNALFFQNQRKIPLNTFRLLREIVGESNLTYILTSRINSDSIKKKYPWLIGVVGLFKREGIDNFPFVNQSAISNLEKWGKGKLKIVTGKSLNIDSRADQILRIINNYSNEQPNLPFITYIVGSSIYDRRAVLKVCKSDPELAKRIVYFDTGHFII